MPDSQIKCVCVGMIQENCYLVKVDETLYIIDPGAEPDRIIPAAEQIDHSKANILLTHAHVDHIAASGPLCKAIDIDTVYLHPDDLKLYKSPDNNLMPFIPAARDLPETAGEYQSPHFKIIHTPGHTRGGVCFHFKNLNVLFAGDTIFSNSIGRTDLPGGDQETLLKSIRDKIFSLPDDLVIYPGHGPTTTIGSEKRTNPYV